MNRCPSSNRIRVAGQRNGKALRPDGLESELRNIRRLLYSEGRGDTLPDTFHGLRAAIAERRCIVHETDGVINGVIIFETRLFESTGRYASTCVMTFALNVLRMLVVSSRFRREGIAQRLVLAAHLFGIVHSTDYSGGTSIRAMASVAAIYESNQNCIKFAEAIAAVLSDPEGAAMRYPGFDRYSTFCADISAAFGRNEEFRIAVLKSTDLFEAAKHALLGDNGIATDEDGRHILTHYDFGDHEPKRLREYCHALAYYRTPEPHDLRLVHRLGLEDSLHTRGQGNVHCGNLTEEMVQLRSI